MTDPRLLMIVPTRGRPHNAEALVAAWDAATGPEAELLFAVDDDDPTLPQYFALGASMNVGERLRLGGTLNEVASRYADDYDAIGFMGDDHRVRTGGWATRLLGELDRLGTGMVYGNDLIQGENLPTAIAMTSDIIRALGYMVPGGLIHMWIDNAWKAWGEGVGRISYLPDVVIEHVHPLVGKAPADDLYRETEALMGADGGRWRDYQVLGGLRADIAKLQALIASKEQRHG